MSILKAEGLVKTFRISEKQRKALGIEDKTKRAVDGISFTAHSGEVFGLLGPNGAGKTTTMRLLSTLIRPDSGDAFYDEISVVKQPELVRSRIAFLTADLKLDIKSTANTMFDFFSELYHVPREEAKKRKTELFEGFRISSFGCFLSAVFVVCQLGKRRDRRIVVPGFQEGDSLFIQLKT